MRPQVVQRVPIQLRGVARVLDGHLMSLLALNGSKRWWVHESAYRNVASNDKWDS